MEFMFVVVVFAAIFGSLGGWIAGQKGREFMEGVLLGGMFGPVGCIIEAVLPAKR